MEKEQKLIKCVVWDLDNTVWSGVLLEDGYVRLRDGVVEIIEELDRRGILQSVSSKNDERTAMDKLRSLGLADYFLYPQINWNSKASSLQKISESLNFNLDTFAFVDDQPFEREEVGFNHPQVLCLDAAELDTLLDRPEFMPRFLTDESAIRRQMYQADIQRAQVEDVFEGPKEEFLASLGMKLTLSPAQEEDLKRAEELTQRTNQLNATGYTYSYEELDAFRTSPDHLLLVASLEDKYGTYGKIGLALLECQADLWTLKLMLMSCRVMSRGVGTILMSHILQSAKQAGVRFAAEFVPTDRNRMMYITYKFAGFKEMASQDGVQLLENDLTRIQPFPEYVEVMFDGFQE